MTGDNPACMFHAISPIGWIIHFLDMCTRIIFTTLGKGYP